MAGSKGIGTGERKERKRAIELESNFAASTHE
jgi:hypothetical protein